MNEAFHVVCTACDAVNRVAEAAKPQEAKCGECHAPLFQAKPAELDAERFSLHLARSQLPLLVDFWAPWCAPCRMMAPMFEQAAAELEPAVRLIKVNTEQNPVISQMMRIRAIPTMALFRGRREIARLSGALAAANIVTWTRQNL